MKNKILTRLLKVSEARNLKIFIKKNYDTNHTLVKNRKILNEFLNETSNRKNIHDQNEIKKLLKKTFTLNEYKISSKQWLELFPVEDIIFGFGGHDQISIKFSNKEICIVSGVLKKETYFIYLFLPFKR